MKAIIKDIMVYFAVFFYNFIRKGFLINNCSINQVFRYFNDKK